MTPTGFELVIIAAALLRFVPIVVFVVLCVFAIRWFLRQEKMSKDPAAVAVRRTLGEALKAHRERCHMTQEFVAQRVGRESSGRKQVGAGGIGALNHQPHQACRRL